MAVFTAIAAATAYVASLGVAAGLTASAALTAATVAVNVALSIGLSLVARLLKPNVKVPVSDIQAVINETTAVRRVYVGQNLVGGVRAFFDVRNSALIQVVVVAHGRLTEFMEFWIDGKPVSVDGDGRVTSAPYKAQGGAFFTEDYYAYVYTRDGSGLGGDYGEVISKFPTSWDASRRLEGQATFQVTLVAPPAQDLSKVYPKGSSTLCQWVVKGQAVYRPREDAFVYDDNAALVIGHYLTHPDGYKLAGSEINWDSVQTMADVASVQVPQQGGGTYQSLSLWGYWTLDESPMDVLARMHSSSGIRAYEMQDGRIGLIGGNFGTPAMTLTAKDIKEIQTSEAINEREGYNILRVFHMDASQKYEVTEVEAWQDSARVAVEGEIVQEYKMDMCPNLSQARRLAKQQISNDNRAKVRVITNLVGLKARFPKLGGQRHTILLDYQPEDGSGRVIIGEYEVMGHEFDPVALECSIDLEEVDRASEEWTVADEGAAPGELPDRVENLAPAIDAVVTQRVIQLNARDQAAKIEVSVVPIAGRSDLTLRAQYKLLAGPDSEWADMQATDYTARSGIVGDGTYQLRAKFDGIFDQPDVWHDIGSINIAMYIVPPGKPTELIPSNGSGYVHLSWRNPNGDFAELRIYRSTGTDFGSAALVGTTGGAAGQISEYQDDTIEAATAYNYWVSAANVNGVEGDPAGPANITAT